MNVAYLMSPYTHDDPRVMQGRYEKAVEAVYALTTKDRIIFSPVVYCHPIALACNLRTDSAFWEIFNAKMLLVSDEGVVLHLKGWIESTGILHEMHIFRKAEKNIYHITLKELGLEEE